MFCCVVRVAYAAKEEAFVSAGLVRVGFVHTVRLSMCYTDATRTSRRPANTSAPEHTSRMFYTHTHLAEPSTHHATRGKHVHTHTCQGTN